MTRKNMNERNKRIDRNFKEPIDKLRAEEAMMIKRLKEVKQKITFG